MLLSFWTDVTPDMLPAQGFAGAALTVTVWFSVTVPVLVQVTLTDTVRSPAVTPCTVTVDAVAVADVRLNPDGTVQA